MAHWLIKEEPTHYSFADLIRDGRTAWEGVKNPLALKHLAAMRMGDRILYYHTGKEKAVVGIARVAAPARPGAGTAREAAVAIEPVRAFPAPVPLAAIKALPAMRDFALVRIPRLSVMPVTDGQWAAIEALAKEEAKES
jgi:predicted RNA-binding protein with PUA-like domain